MALIGNPNAGKTTLFNQLTGLRAKTANFAGTTIEHRIGRLQVNGHAIEMLDLPGLYGLTAHNIEERVAKEALLGERPGLPKPDAVLLVMDATNLSRNLYLAGQVRELHLPTVVALNMSDLAARQGIWIDVPSLSRELGAPVVPVSARSGAGLRDLRDTLQQTLLADAEALPPVPAPLAACATCGGCPHAARYDWAESVDVRVSQKEHEMSNRMTERIDRFIAHPVAGLGVFATIMAGLFIMIFALADYPMSWIEAGFEWLGGTVASWLPPGDLSSFLVDGVIGGVGGVVVFLPQICILFFILTLLEDTGYLSRAAFVMDKWMRKVGLPGKAFVPMLSAHACAIPAIMSTRVIENRRDRLATILVIPLMTCSARLPVYAMIVALLFAGDPVSGGLVFFGAYALGAVMAFVMAFIFKRTILPGESQPMVLEMPSYKLPSLKVATLTMIDRGMAFLKNAGTVILLISIILWAAATYPKLPADRVADYAPASVVTQFETLDGELSAAEAARNGTKAETIEGEIAALVGPYEAEHSIAGRIGKAVEPVFRPLGFDWKINVGVISSFAAREVIVSSLAIVYGIGEEGAEDERSLTETIRKQKRPDGTPVFDLATSLSLLVFFVLAMQCLPTQAVTRRETGSWRWAIFQLVYMSVLAYAMAWLTHTVVGWLA